MTTSIGIALAVPDDTPDTLLRRADAALYRSKEAGRDRCTLDNGRFDSPGATA